MNVHATRTNVSNYNIKASKNYSKHESNFSTYFNDPQLSDNELTKTESSAMIGGMYWDDVKLADAMKRFDNATINTDRAINWGTNGEHQLSTKEIETLRNKYDVTNLSEQGFYDLMVDLSELNAIKPEDIVSRYHFKAPTVYFEKAALISPGTITEKDYHNGKPIQNLFEELQGRVDYYSANNDSINSAEFVRLNQFVFNQDRFQHLLFDLKVNAQECYQESNRYYNIIAQLKRKDES